MAEKDTMRDAKNFCVHTPMRSEPFSLRGSNSLDWGFKNRLSNIFHPKTGRTVMLAIDHGYFLGPTEGLERVDLTIVPLLPYADTLMCTRGILRSTIPPTFTKGIVLRSSGGPSILKELSNEEIAVDVEDADDGALLAEPLGDGPADPAGATGDDDILVLQAAHFRIPPRLTRSGRRSRWQA